MHCKDQLHRELHFDSPPKTIVSLVPSITALLVALGLEAQLVGVTKFCVSPKHLRKTKTVVGGTKTVHQEKIAELLPEVIIANKEENTKEMVSELSNIAPVWVSNVYDFKSHIELVSALGKLFNREDRAERLIEKMHQERTAFEAFMLENPWRKGYYLIWKDPYMVAGEGTFIDDMLRCNHFKNLCKKTRYPVITEAALKNADVLLLSSEPYPFTKERAKEIEKRLGVKTILVDGAAFSWYGGNPTEVYKYFRSLH